jgi:Protein of unknown function (DUF3348)
MFISKSRVQRDVGAKRSLRRWGCSRFANGDLSRRGDSTPHVNFAPFQIRHMTKVSQHTGLTGSELIRLLAQLAGPQGEGLSGAVAPAFSTQLSQWLGWTDAVALASALDSGAPVGLPGQGDTAAQLLEEGLRVRAALAKALCTPGADSAGPGRWPVKPRAGARLGATIEEDPTDFATHRRQVHAQQQAMETAVSGLRARLRPALAAASPRHAKLAAVDAVMEQALLPQAQRLTSAVGLLLERRFRALQAGVDGVAERGSYQKPAPLGSPSPQPSPGGRGSEKPPHAWLQVFRQDLEAVLLAELDFRFQPIEGLMTALRSTLLATPEAALETT